jgi:hypothetical protein
MYNRVKVGAFVGDSTNTWTYATNTVRASNNSAGMRVSLFQGLSEERVESTFAQAITATSDALAIGIGLDSTTAFATNCRMGSGTGISEGFFIGSWQGLVGLGRHFLQALEVTISGSVTYFGDNNAPTRHQNGLMVNTRM